MALTYGDYLKIDELLDLQQPLSEEPQHDEVLFIIIHQTYELWFKQILHELGWLQQALEAERTIDALAAFKRILTILKTLVGQVDILETMTPVSFLAFRERIQGASGFQSLQFREIEFTLGQRDAKVLGFQPEGSPARRKLEALLESPSLWDSFLTYLSKRGYGIAPEVLNRDRRQPLEENEGLQQVLVQIYREDPEVREVCERLVDLDEGLQEWRYRHVKLVQRTIGMKRGTGGSSGSRYLASTLGNPLFPDLWAIRTAL